MFSLSKNVPIKTILDWSSQMYKSTCGHNHWHRSCFFLRSIELTNVLPQYHRGHRCTGLTQKHILLHIHPLSTHTNTHSNRDSVAVHGVCSLAVSWCLKLSRLRLSHGNELGEKWGMHQHAFLAEREDKKKAVICCEWDLCNSNMLQKDTFESVPSVNF